MHTAAIIVPRCCISSMDICVHIVLSATQALVFLYLSLWEEPSHCLVFGTCSWCPACQRLPSMGTGCKWDKLVQQWQHICWHLICAHTDKVWSDGPQQGPTAPTSMQQWMSCPYQSSSCSSHHAPDAPRKRGILWDFYRRNELPSAELRRDAKWPSSKGRS